MKINVTLPFKPEFSELLSKLELIYESGILTNKGSLFTSMENKLSVAMAP